MKAVQGVSLRATCPVASGVLGNGGVGRSSSSKGIGQKPMSLIAFAGRQNVRASSSGSFPFSLQKPPVFNGFHSVPGELREGQLGVRCLLGKKSPPSVKGESNPPQKKPLHSNSCHTATSSFISPPDMGSPVEPRLSETGPWWVRGEWLAAVLRKAGPVLTTVCLALAWILVKPSPAFAASQLARPPSVTSVVRHIESKQFGGLSAGVVPSQADVQSSKGPVLDTTERLVHRVETRNSSSLAPLSEDVSAPATCPSNQFQLPSFASLSQAVSPFPTHSTPPSSSFGRERITAPRPADLEASQPSTSEPQSRTTQPPPTHRTTSTAPIFEQAKATQQSPILEDLFRKGGFPSPQGGASSSTPPGDSNNPDGKKGVQQREKLDVYFLPDQIPRPKEGEWVSDQGRFLEPPWIPVRINQIVNGLKKDTETEIVVVAINALGKHAGGCE